MPIRIKDKRRVGVEICASLLILLFVYAGASKLMDFDRYVGEINNQPLDNRWTPFITTVIPGSEFLVSLLLFFDKSRNLAFWASAIMMTLFTIYIGMVLLNVWNRQPCTCGGVIGDLTWLQHLYFNLFFLATAVSGIILQTRIQKFPPTQANETGIVVSPT